MMYIGANGPRFAGMVPILGALACIELIAASLPPDDVAFPEGTLN